jgi:aryl-alcohol dehydrogenase-like predicted oxidoreductase
MAEVVPQMALGTAQWGLNYGLANRDGQPSRETVRQMMEVALNAGVDVLDTARAYGESEAVIGSLLPESGRAFRVVTKLAPDIWRPGMSADQAIAGARVSLHASLGALRDDRLDTMLLHRAEHRTCCGGEVWDWLKLAREDGRIGKLGLSAATPDEGMEAVADPDVEVIQVAASILDQRLVRRGFFAAAARTGKEIHVRSVYLQGVAFIDPDALPAHLQPIRPQLRRIAGLARRLRCEPAQVWLNYGRTLPATRIVVGSENVVQVESNIVGFATPISPEVRELEAELPLAPADILDPARWPC